MCVVPEWKVTESMACFPEMPTLCSDSGGGAGSIRKLPRCENTHDTGLKCTWLFSFHVFLCIMWMCATLGGQKRAWDLLGPKLCQL